MNNNVQISKLLFDLLIEYFVEGKRDSEHEERIKRLLMDKLYAMAKHKVYSYYCKSEGEQKDIYRTAYDNLKREQKQKLK